MTKKIILFTALLLSLVACNMIEGLGRDVSASARAVNNAL